MTKTKADQSPHPQPSSPFILSMFDVNGIQEYIFASNRLKENAGASQIVGKLFRQVLEKNLKAAVQNAVIPYDWSEGTDKLTIEELKIKNNSDIQAELLYCGGGKAMIAFRTKELYDDFSKRMSMSVFTESYSLTLLTVFTETDMKKFSEDRTELENKLIHLKTSRPYSQPYGLLPIEEEEAESKGAVVTTDEEGTLSIPRVLKQAAYEETSNGRNRESSMYCRPIPEGKSFAIHTDDLIRRKNEDSYVAVVHIDGNGMGEYIHREIEKCSDYPQEVRRMRQVSKEIADINQDIFETMVKAACTYCDNYGNRSILPLRPLIMDGDDVTFITRADWGIPFAVFFLRTMLRAAQNKNISACAGIALVHSHYPFSNAYEIAEDCCSRAKRKRVDEIKNKKLSDMTGYLDYCLVRGSYTEDANRPCGAGPLRVDAEPSHMDLPGGSIDTYYNIMKKVQQKSKSGKPVWPRSRLERLYQTYADGTEDFSMLIQEYKSRGYDIQKLAGSNISLQPPTPLYNVLETSDMFDAKLYKILMGAEV